MKDPSRACRKLSDRIAWYPTGRLSRRDEERIESHAASCPSCRALLDSAGWLRAELGRLAASHPEVDAMCAFAERDPTQPPWIAAVIEKHLETCAPCREEMAILEEVTWGAAGGARPIPRRKPAHAPSVRRWIRGLIPVRPVPAVMTLTAAALLLGTLVLERRPSDVVTFRLDAELPGVEESDAAWGDFDGDGDLDLVISGIAAGGPITQTYENRSSGLVPRQALPGVHNVGSGNLAWADYDADGDLDLAIAGTLADSTCTTRVYANDGSGNLAWDRSQDLAGLTAASLAWGDFDNDGDLDLLAMGLGPPCQTLLYRNDPPGHLALDDAASASLPPLCCGSADWGDADGDGDLDLLLTGNDDQGLSQAFLLRNEPVGTLVEEEGPDHGVPGVNLSDAAWGDVDADGDLDLALTGCTRHAGPYLSIVLRNDGSGAFGVVGQTLGMYRSSCAFCDADGDGDMDAAFLGYTDATKHCLILENTGSADTMFVARDSGAQGLDEGALTWADVNQDGRADLFLTGKRFPTRAARLYMAQAAEGAQTSAPPSSPAVLAAEWRPEDGTALFSWDGGSDEETPEAGLSFRLRITRMPGGRPVLGGMGDSPLLGTTGPARHHRLRLPPGSYSWSVQAIDPGLQTSAWAPDQVLLVGPVP